MKTYKLISQYPPQGKHDFEEPASFEAHFQDHDTEEFCLTCMYQVQGNNINGTKHREDMTTASVGDLITTTEQHGDITLPKTWAVAPVGFLEIDQTVVHRWFKEEPAERAWIIRDLARNRNKEQA